MALLDLSNELVIQIVSNLTHRDIIACQLSNKLLYTIIKDSVLLQFQIALSTFKAIDNPSSSLSLSERFRALKDYEDSWSYLRQDFERDIPVMDYNVSGIYDLTNGVFLFGNAGRNALHYIKLPSSIGDSVEGQAIQLDHNEGMIFDMAFCLVEHDMLVVATTKPRHKESEVVTYDIKLVLFKLSTGKPHPAAKESTIFVINSKWDRPGIVVEIVGDQLILILTYHNNPWRPHDHVFIYDWRNAVQKLSFTVPYCSYSGLVFLSENLIAIPNARTNALEIWDLSSIQRTPHPTCILQLPEPYTGNIVIYITCRGEPNPIGSGSQLPPNKPFYQSAHEAIIVFHVRLQIGGPEEPEDYIYTLFVHRKALCEFYGRHLAHMNNQPTEDSLDVPDISGQSENSGYEIVYSDDSSDDEDGIAVRATYNDPIPIPWASWGPPITRLFPQETNSNEWITTCGQRAVFMEKFPGHPTGRRYIILDFNLENVRRMEIKHESSPFMPFLCSHNMRSIKTQGVFQDAIVSDLPFVSCISENGYDWHAVLMDEDRVLGIRLDDVDRLNVLKVHHFGGPQN